MMGWVVYDAETRELLRYYDSAQSAQQQVKRHNAKVIMLTLRNQTRPRPWACLEWQDYEREAARHYQRNHPTV